MAFTEQQQSAINARGKVLVSASAGAGKTTVMIKRLADILAEGASLDNVLAVTFTKKAAAQMKEKLRAELVSRLSVGDEAGRENIRVQLGKINSADISTIHSFCARLVRTYFYAFEGVDASFEIIADGAEAEQLRSRAMDNLFDKLYGKGDGHADDSFLYLVDRLKKKRNDAPLRQAILQAYDRIRIEPDYESVAQKAERTFSDEGFAAVCARLGEIAGMRCAFYAEEVKRFSNTLAFASKGGEYSAMLDEIYDSLNYVAAKRDIFDRPAKLSKKIKPSVKPENAEEDARFAQFLDAIKKRYKNTFKDVKTYEEERAAFDESGVLARIFADVVLQFDREYTEVKREEGKLDYGDLEHLAYALVCADKGVDGDVKAQINGKYAFVFVDEYQDVNPIQDAIINAVAGGDLFKVGDVKQAIYGFRGSRSHFFAEQLNEAAKNSGSIVLPHNFRSTGAVVDMVNELFSKVMNNALCGFDYADGNHAMISGNAKSANRGVAQICTFEGEEKRETEVDGVYSIVDELPENAPPTAQCGAILSLVDELLRSEYYDAERDEMRPIQQGDICILTRKNNNKGVREAERALLAKGYRVDGAAESNVCDNAKIKRMINILSYLDNAEQDVPLAAALLSPLGNLDEDELAEIRLFGGTGKNAPPFRRCAERYAHEKRDALAKKLCDFYEKTDSLKKLAQGIGAARLIDEITDDGGFVAQYADGDSLTALRRLQREAYSPCGELSLNAFLAKLKAADYKVNCPLPPSSDSIKIMTMHSSKGLEFPVVIVADIAAGFKGDDRTEIHYDEEFGFAPKFYDKVSKVYGGTLLRKLCALRAEAEELKNEINLFYVACTRAKSNLYVLNSKREKHDNTGVLNADRYADLFDMSSLKKAVIRHISADESEKLWQSERRIQAIDERLVNAELYGNMDKIFASALKGGDSELPVKSSATKLLSLTADDEIHPVMFAEEESEAGETSIESGLAYHRFLQLCDFNIKNEAGIKSQIESLSEGGLLSASQRDLLEVGQLIKILSLPRFSTLAGNGTYREREFLCALSAGEYVALAGGKIPRGEGDGPSVIIQGAIDLLAVREQGGKVVGADIIDYKYSSRTDRALKEKYTAQLALYKRAVARIYGLSADKISTTIINIRACREIPVDV